ncbi:hypothetical protein I546_5730 [Mycobacterium kansasii 732]|nr:hypothetical protein I546_5730 [Mycobacterium kansasii 732]
MPGVPGVRGDGSSPGGGARSVSGEVQATNRIPTTTMAVTPASSARYSAGLPAAAG